MRKIKILLATALLCIGFYACSTVAISGRNRVNLVPDSQVLQASFAQYKQYIAQAPKSKNTKATQRVINIGQRIAKATDSYLRSIGLSADADSYRWEFNLIASSDVNAFCMPGGKIVVYEGILPIAATDDELATVISHEVAHAMAKHANERMSQQILKQYGASALGLILSGKGNSTQQVAGILYGIGSEALITLPYSRKHEHEADVIGLYLMALAGYDYTQAENFWVKMANGKGNSTDFWSTHPSDAKRIKVIQDEIPKVKAFILGNKNQAPVPKNAQALAPNQQHNLQELNAGRTTPIQTHY